MKNDKSAIEKKKTALRRWLLVCFVLIALSLVLIVWAWWNEQDFLEILSPCGTLLACSASAYLFHKSLKDLEK
ncbi:MAG: hypothetical protein LBN29_03010 [Mediterranea sp.]|jgi:1,4-dihydroxy-2-naphthoate octaprenyltransferase|nr:hypothetical protein [Mediterranea sp.]